ncbi:MAG: hypothetical protein ACT4P6_16240 [Gemmatimonadaceae bacterium]
MIETVLFYHPSIWFVSKRIREEREHCCDDLAVAASGDAKIYASALLELEIQRLAGIQLAMAATGGALLHRVRRLVTPGSVDGAEGSRWFAGVFVLAAVLLVAGGARLLRAEPGREDSGNAPNDNVTVESEPPRSAESAVAPDTVIIYRGSEPLDARTRWAHDVARQHGLRRYWVGYAVEGDVDRGWVYFNRHVPVRAAGCSTINGRLWMKEPSGLLFSGQRLDRLVPRRPASDVAILFGFVVRGGRAVLDRIHAGNFIFPVALDGRDLVWLGASADAPSIALAQEVFASAPTSQLQEDVAGIVGVHNDSELVRPVLSRRLEALKRIVERDESLDIQREAVETMGELETERALVLITEIARSHRSDEIRREAVETLGEAARAHPNRQVRRKAIEALGESDDPRARTMLERILIRP